MSEPQQVPGGPSPRRLVRTDGMVGGVCGGLAAYLGTDVTVVRVVVAVAALLTLPLGPLAYLVLWALMPKR